MIGIINYGLGNVKAILNLYNYHNVQAKLISSKKDFDLIDRLILPGVGSFDNAIKLFNSSGMREVTEKMVFEKKMPLLGICVGMQMLGNNSEEGNQKGLSWINGDIKKIDFINEKLPLPHLGWNKITLTKKSKILNGLDNHYFYFLHSYYFFENEIDLKIATFEYQTKFTCAVNKDNIYGVQFHPEKSHSSGSDLLINFSKI